MRFQIFSTTYYKSRYRDISNLYPLTNIHIHIHIHIDKIQSNLLKEIALYFLNTQIQKDKHADSRTQRSAVLYQTPH